MDIKKKIRILLVDKDENSRKALLSILEKKQDMEIIAEAMDSQTTTRFTGELMPDIVVIDYALPYTNGLDNIKHIITVSPGGKVLVVLMYSDSRYVLRALNAGASGYMLKDRAYEELAKAISVIVSNKTYISPGIAGIVKEE